MTQIWLVRHGATAWSSTGQHTGRTDVPLVAEGEARARALAPRLSAVHFDLVVTSPLQRARRTAALAGFPDARVEPLAVEWDYGDYEGLTRAQVQEKVPGWSAWGYPDMPGGEHLDDVAKRADTVAEHLATVERALLFAHGHFLRVFAARFIGQPAPLAEFLALDPAHVGVVEVDRGIPMIQTWNA